MRNDTIDLSQTPEQIALNLKQEFAWTCTEDGNTLPLETATKCAILCVENMLKVCPRYLQTLDERPDPNYLKLTQTLNILKK